MPIMMRPDGPAKRIARALLGTPDSMRKKKATKKQQRVKRILVMQESIGYK